MFNKYVVEIAAALPSLLKQQFWPVGLFKYSVCFHFAQNKTILFELLNANWQQEVTPSFNCTHKRTELNSHFLFFTACVFGQLLNNGLVDAAMGGGNGDGVRMFHLLREVHRQRSLHVRTHVHVLRMCCAAVARQGRWTLSSLSCCDPWRHSYLQILIRPPMIYGKEKIRLHKKNTLKNDASRLDEWKKSTFKSLLFFLFFCYDTKIARKWLSTKFQICADVWFFFFSILKTISMSPGYFVIYFSSKTSVIGNLLKTGRHVTRGKFESLMGSASQFVKTTGKCSIIWFVKGGWKWSSLEFVALFKGNVAQFHLFIFKMV